MAAEVKHPIPIPSVEVNSIVPGHSKTGIQHLANTGSLKIVLSAGRISPPPPPGVCSDYVLAVASS